VLIVIVSAPSLSGKLLYRVWEQKQRAAKHGHLWQSICAFELLYLFLGLVHIYGHLVGIKRVEFYIEPMN
jgi:hypothetical protein